MPQYSIAICNYNMGNTIEEAIESILRQVDERFEVVVVDDGSTDQSVEVLRRMARSEDALRVIELPPSRNRKLGATRNISVHAADGDYVLLHLDADDTFAEGITDVVDVFEAVNEHINHDFYFTSCGFGIGKREFLLDYGPYRNLPVGGEDQDMWRRLLADDVFIRIDSEDLYKVNRGKKTRWALAKRWFRVAVSNFQTGISYRSYLSWSHQNRTPLGFLYDFILCAPIAYAVAKTRKSYSLPTEFREKGIADDRLRKESISLRELESEFGFQIEDDLSERAKELFYLD